MASQLSPRDPSRVNRLLAPAFLVLALLLVVLLLAAPEEATLGRVVRLVYLHGAMVRTAILLLAAALPLHLLVLAGRGGRLLQWAFPLTSAGTLVWMAHTLLSVVTTRAAWGIWIAWDEPRTVFTFAVAGFALLAAASSRMLAGDRLAHLPPLLLSAALLGLVPRLGFLQHPIDPIGRSTSASIRGFYVAILIVAAAMGLLLSAFLRDRRR